MKGNYGTYYKTEQKTRTKGKKKALLEKHSTIFGNQTLWGKSDKNHCLTDHLIRLFHHRRL